MADKILVTRSSMPEYEEYIEEIKDMWDSHWLTNRGAKHNQLEQELTDYLKVDHVSLLVNGHMALEVSLQALGLKGEIITTPFTFVSTTHAIVRSGCTPVFCDINTEDFTIDVNKIEALITDKTVAIMPVHVYGNVCNVEEIERIAGKHGLKVIYDAAHTFGVEYKNRGIASYGDVSCFSFHATKVFNTIEGGAITYNNTMQDSFGDLIWRIKDFGIRDEDVIDEIGTNGKMNEFCAAMGLCNLRHVDGEIQKRKKVYDRYHERLDGTTGLKLFTVQNHVKPNYAYFPVTFDPEVFGVSRDEVFEKLAENNIGARKYFYPLTNAIDCYDFDPYETPIALDTSLKVLTLPMFADLTVEQVDRICDVILSCRKQ